jgi:hypothetical protein
VAETANGVLVGWAPASVEKVFVSAFAGYDADVSGYELACEGSIVEGVEEVVGDEGVVGCWAEFVEVYGCCGAEEGVVGCRAEAAEFLGGGEGDGDVEGGEELVELGLGEGWGLGMYGERVGPDAGALYEGFAVGDV